MRTKMTFSATGDSLMVKRMPTGYKGFKPISNFIKSAQVKLTNLETVLSSFEQYESP